MVARHRHNSDVQIASIVVNSENTRHRPGRNDCIVVRVAILANGRECTRSSSGSDWRDWQDGLRGGVVRAEGQVSDQVMSNGDGILIVTARVRDGRAAGEAAATGSVSMCHVKAGESKEAVKGA